MLTLATIHFGRSTSDTATRKQGPQATTTTTRRPTSCASKAARDCQLSTATPYHMAKTPHSPALAFARCVATRLHLHDVGVSKRLPFGIDLQVAADHLAEGLYYFLHIRFLHNQGGAAGKLG